MIGVESMQELASGMLSIAPGSSELLFGRRTVQNPIRDHCGVVEADASLHLEQFGLPLVLAPPGV